MSHGRLNGRKRLAGNLPPEDSNTATRMNRMAHPFPIRQNVAGKINETKTRQPSPDHLTGRQVRHPVPRLRESSASNRNITAVGIL
jgi:hypothetical protein